MTRAQRHWTVVLLLLASIHTGCVYTYQTAEMLELQKKLKELNEQTRNAVDGTPKQAVRVTADRVQVTIQTGHVEGIGAVAVSPNGRYIASAGADDLKLWDVASGQEIRTITGLKTVNNITFSDDSSQVVVEGYYGMMKIFEVVSGEIVRDVGRVSEGEFAVMSPNGRFAAVRRISIGDVKWDPTTPSKINLPVIITGIDLRNGKTIWTVQGEYQDPQALSQDGKTLLTAKLDRPGSFTEYLEAMGGPVTGELLVWDLVSKTLRRTLPYTPSSSKPSLSADGRYSLTAEPSLDPKIFVHDVETGRLAQTFATGNSTRHVRSRFSPDGKMLALATSNTAKLLEFPSGREVKTFQGSAVNFSSDGRTLVIGDSEGGAPFLYDLASGKESRLVGGASAVTDLALAPDSRSAVAGMAGGSAKLWDLTTGQLVRTFDCPNRMAVTSVAVSSAMPVLATGCRDASVWLWDLATGRQLRNLLPPLPPDKSFPAGMTPVSVRVSHDGRMLVMGVADQLVFWDLVSGKAVRRITIPLTALPASNERPKKIPTPGDFYKIPTPADIESAAKRVSERDMAQEGWQENWIYSLDIHPDGQLIAARRRDATTTLWNLSTGQQVVQSTESLNLVDWDVVTGQAWRTSTKPRGLKLFDLDNILVYDSEGNLLLSGRRDGSLRVWSRPDTRELAALIALGREDFITVTPDHYYRASKASIKGVSFKVGEQRYPFEQFDLRFNRPDIVLQRLGLASSELVQSYRFAYEKRLKKMGLTEQKLGLDFHLPEVEVLTKDVPMSVGTATLTLRVKATDNKYSLDRLNVFVNDIPIYGTTGLPFPTKQVQVHEQDLLIPLVSGRNKIQVSVLNQQGVESLRQTVYTTSTAQVAPPDVYVVAIGVSEYQNKAYSLLYAAKDATDLLHAYQAIEQRPNSQRKVHVLSLTDKKATSPEILKAKEWLKQSKINDLVVVFAAGHGMTDEQSNYYFGTHDIDPVHPATNGLPYEEFENLLDGIPALQKVLLLDTCFSGEIEKDQAVVVAKAETGGSGTVKMRTFKAARGITVVAGARESAPAEPNTPRLYNDMVKFQQDWFADLRRGTGAAVISSSSGNEYSLEGEQWKNGVFTYALLNGLKNRGADADKDQTITVSELQRYVIDQVRKLTQDGQNPTVRHENLEYDFAVY